MGLCKHDIILKPFHYYYFLTQSFIWYVFFTKKEGGKTWMVKSEWMNGINHMMVLTIWKQKCQTYMISVVHQAVKKSKETRHFLSCSCSYVDILKRICELVANAFSSAKWHLTTTDQDILSLYGHKESSFLGLLQTGTVQTYVLAQSTSLKKRI